MRQKSVHPESSSERIVKTIRRATRKRHSSEEKIQIVLDGLRGESSIAELCRREGIAEGLYYAWSKEFLEAGKRRLRALAIATLVRIEELSDVPTVAESGYTGYEAILWTGMLAPAKTSKDMIAETTGWLTSALQDPETRQKLIAQGLSPLVTCGADFGALIRKQYDEYGRIIGETEIKAD